MAKHTHVGSSTRLRAIGLTTIGIGALVVAAGCSSNSDSSTTPTPTVTVATPTVTETATATAEPVAGIPAPPAGSIKISGNETYSRYKNSAKDPAEVVSFYKGELTKAGYKIVKQNAGGGGWGPYGGAGAGLHAQKGEVWTGVGAGAQKSAPTYFSVCTAKSESGISRCDGENDQNENSKSSSS
ncbi:MAG: hypothetical protein ACOYD0_07370 [Candidatus Nanopelagicales bacterium]